jgi:hypothetical protein
MLACGDTADTPSRLSRAHRTDLHTDALHTDALHTEALDAARHTGRTLAAT